MCSFTPSKTVVILKNATKNRKTRLSLTLLPRHSCHVILELRPGPVQAAGRRERDGEGRINESRSLTTTGGTQLLNARGVGPAGLRGTRDTECPQIHPVGCIERHHARKGHAPKGHHSSGSPITLVWAGISHSVDYNQRACHDCKIGETYQSLVASDLDTIPLRPTGLRGRERRRMPSDPSCGVY